MRGELSEKVGIRGEKAERERMFCEGYMEVKFEMVTQRERKRVEGRCQGNK